MSIEIRSKGNLAKRLNELANLKDVQNAVKLNTTEMHRRASRKVAVDTGHLKRSLTIDFSDGGLTGRVSTGVEYAMYVEYGTRYHTGKAFFRPALYEQRPLFAKDMSRLLKK